MSLSKDGLNRYSVRRQSYSALGSSFMFLCFVTAALLIAVQGHEAFSRRSATQRSATQQASRQINNQADSPASSLDNNGQLANNQLANSQALPNQSTLPDPQLPVLASPPQNAGQSVAQLPTLQSPPAQTATDIPALRPGLAEILSASLQPVAVIYQPRLIVSLSARQVTLYQNDQPQATYDIAVGREGWETPTGSFQILNLRENPGWRNPITGEVVTDRAENPLGSRWIGFWTDGKHQIGFHGTNQDELIGQAVSHGCIRMRDADIQALFTQVAVGTPVIVEP
jgi:lipoprotein-anchoring transpeptidase ErfK/SrfK